MSPHPGPPVGPDPRRGDSVDLGPDRPRGVLRGPAGRGRAGRRGVPAAPARPHLESRPALAQGGRSWSRTSRSRRPIPLPFDVPFRIGACCLTLRQNRTADPDWGMYETPSPSRDAEWTRRPARRAPASLPRRRPARPRSRPRGRRQPRSEPPRSTFSEAATPRSPDRPADESRPTPGRPDGGPPEPACSRRRAASDAREGVPSAAARSLRRRALEGTGDPGRSDRPSPCISRPPRGALTPTRRRGGPAGLSHTPCGRSLARQGATGRPDRPPARPRPPAGRAELQTRPSRREPAAIGTA